MLPKVIEILISFSFLTLLLINLNSSWSNGQFVPDENTNETCKIAIEGVNSLGDHLYDLFINYSYIFPDVKNHSVICHLDEPSGCNLFLCTAYQKNGLEHMVTISVRLMSFCGENNDTTPYMEITGKSRAYKRDFVVKAPLNVAGSHSTDIVMPLPEGARARVAIDVKAKGKDSTETSENAEKNLFLAEFYSIYCSDSKHCTRMLMMILHYDPLLVTNNYCEQFDIDGHAHNKRISSAFIIQ